MQSCHEAEYTFCPEWLPLEEVIREVEFNQDEAEEMTAAIVPEGAIKEEYYHALWLPFATDGFGNFLAVDTDQGETGTKGQVITYGSDLRRCMSSPSH